ncbi:MAG: putative sugar nucleotidyl transferase, partial [Bacteroidota bacterium]
MHICLFEDAVTEHLRPLVDLRPVYDLRTGMRTNLERVRELFPDAGLLLHARSVLMEAALERYGAPVNRIPDGLNVLFLNGRLLLDGGELTEEVRRLTSSRSARVLTSDGAVVAAWMPDAKMDLARGTYLSPE